MARFEDYGSDGCPDYRYPSSDGGRPVPLTDVFGPSDTRTPWVNRSTQTVKAALPPPDDRPIPVYLRVGQNLLTPEAFQIAARKLLPAVRVVRPGDPVTLLELALKTGHFVTYGVECVRVNETPNVGDAA